MNTLTLINGNSYPIFAPNQVLSDRDLNRVVAYLDSQNRLTRTYLLGMGIVCGLEVSSTFQTAPQVQAQLLISSGCGVTSEGYVIALTDTKLTHYLHQSKLSPDLFKPSTDPTVTESSTNTNTAAKQIQYEAIELFEQAGGERSPLHQIAGDNSTEASFTQFLANQVLIVLYELQEELRDSCLLDCDDLGRDRNFRLRYLLLPQETPDADPQKLSAKILLQQGYAVDREPWREFSIDEIFNLRQSFLSEFYPEVQRFGYQEPSPSTPAVQLTEIVNYEVYQQGYYDVCVNAIEAIAQAFPALFQLFSPFFSSFQPNSSDFNNLRTRLLDRLQAIVPDGEASTEPTEARYALQYFYDYLSQLVAAYRELTDAAFDLMDDCVPDRSRFPKYLMLGAVAASNQSPLLSESSPYRSQFIQPPIYNGNQQRVKQVRHLYDRLVRLCDDDGFYLLPFYATPLKITPSPDRSQTLSEQAIPYYLNYPQLYRYWNYDRDRKGRSGHHPAYFDPPGTPTHPPDLIHRLDDYSFYRIEGHIGKDKQAMLERLREEAQRWNLAFDVVTLKIGETVDADDLDGPEEADQTRQLNAIKQDFEGMKQVFQQVWEIYQESWSANVFLSTLKQVFFDRAEFSDITLDQLYDPILAAIRADTEGAVYEFEPEQDANNRPTGRYRLFIQIANETGETRLARVTFQDGNSTTEFLNWSGLSPDTVTKEQKQIGELLSQALSADKLTYGVDPSTSPPEHIYVILTILESFNLRILSTSNAVVEEVSVKLITQDHFTVNRTGPLPLIEQQTFQKFEILYGLLRDVPENDVELNRLSLGGNHAAAVDYIDGFHLIERIEAYTSLVQQLEQRMPPHLFHQFAQVYPGMEHLGGVPCGGTLVLAYTDDSSIASDLVTVFRSPIYNARTDAVKQSAALPPAAPDELESIQDEFSTWKNIVVADYCLPYRCWNYSFNGCQPHLQLHPIILLEKTSFCEDDQTRYEFLLHPPNGNLKGEGTSFASGKYYFQPNQVQTATAHDLVLVLSYVVDGCESILAVTLNPLPDASFKLGGADKTTFCADDDAIPLIPQTSGGTFRAFDGEREVANLIQNNQFLPRQVALDGATQKVITLKHTVTSKHGCTNQTERQVTIHRVPNAAFQVGDGKTTNFCANVGDVDLIPVEPNGVFRALEGDRDISTRVLEGDRFLPSNVYLGKASQKNITLEYAITSATGCTHSTTQTVTVHWVPKGEFQASIDTISTTGFSVRVFDIGPADPPARFNWQTPNGDRNPEEPTNEEFTINYTFDQVKTPTVSITLDVTTDANCSSEPVTQTLAVPFEGLESLNLLTINSDRINRIPLADRNSDRINRILSEDRKTFRLSQLSGPYTFEAGAIANAGSVIFTYTPPGGGETIVSSAINAVLPMTAPYYFRMLNAAGRLWRWQPTVGRHEVEVQPFQGLNGTGAKGIPLKAVFIVRDDSSSGGGGSPDPSGITATEDLNRGLEFNRTTPSEFPIGLSEATLQAESVLPADSDQPSSEPPTILPHQDSPEPAAPPIPTQLEETPSVPFHHPIPEPASTRLNIAFIYNLKNRLSQALTLGAIAALVILGWTYSASLQTEKPNPTNHLGNVQNSTK